MKDVNALLESIVVELKRGTLTLVVLSQLTSPQYGYSLVQTLGEREAHVEAGTLYPLLRRLEQQGLLTSSWDTRENKPRKYYVLSRNGKEALTLLRREWESLSSIMNKLLKGVT